MRRSSMRRRVLRGGRRVRRRVGVSRGRGVGFRSRRMSLRLYSRTESKYWDDNGQTILSVISPRSYGYGDNLDVTEYLQPVVGGRVLPYLISAIAQGAGATQRVGNRIMMRNVRFSCILSAAQLKGGLYLNDELTGSTNNVGTITESSGLGSNYGTAAVVPQKFLRTTFRIVFVRDRMVSLNTSVPAAPHSPGIDDIFALGGGLYTTANLNLTSLGRFQVLYDRKFTCDSDDPQRSLTMNVSLNAPCHFGGAGSTDIREGAIYFMVFAATAGLESASVTGRFFGPSVTYNTRLAYTDR